MTETRRGAEYEGFRVAIPARLGSARLVARVDVGFGDSVHPEPAFRPFPTLLGHAPPRIRAYPLEAAIAEKLEAICDLGVINSRMKDFYDLDRIAACFPIGGESLAVAIRATFRRRRTPIPRETPVGLTEAFAECAEKRTLWDAFRERHRITGPRRRLVDVSRGLRTFAMPALVAAAYGRDPGVWIPSRGWTDSSTES